jgi:IS30 family transposase
MSGVEGRSQALDATFYLKEEMECMVMGQRFHRGFTAAEKTELWDRWKRGESLKAIGRAFGKPSSSIYFLVAPHGGIRPALRRRSRLALTLSEREVISRGIAAHQSARSIAKLLGRSPSTVSREMSRNGGYDRYRAALADENAWARSRRPKCCKLANSPRLRQAVAGKLRLDWSPEQIAGWLKRMHPEDECNQVSHETIYRSLFVQTRGVLKKELLSHLRSKRSMRRSKPADPNGDRRGHIKDIVSIRQRPAAVEDRAVPGHWEGDLLSGPNNSYIATLVERHTRYVMLAKVAGKDTQTVVSALIKQAKRLPNELYKSLTWDRGKELTDHRRFTLATDAVEKGFSVPERTRIFHERLPVENIDSGILRLRFYYCPSWMAHRSLIDFFNSIDQYRRLFLRSAKSLAARVEREHQWPAETVLSEGHRLVGALASLSEQSGSSAKRTTT